MMRYPAEFMRPQSLIISLIVGAILGVLASMVVKGNRYGAIGDVITGIIGALVLAEPQNGAIRSTMSG